MHSFLFNPFQLFTTIYEVPELFQTFKLTNGGVQIIILMMKTKKEDKEATGKIDVDTPHDSVVQRFLRKCIGLPGDAGHLFDEQRR
jgi:hypothetical protein